MIEPITFPFLPEHLKVKLNLLAKSLIKNLNDEINIYSELYQLFQAEREIIRTPSIEALRDNNLKMKECLDKVRIYNDRKEVMLKAIKQLFPPGWTGKASLSSLSGYTDGGLRQQLLECSERLHELIRDVRTMSDKNRDLLSCSISHTRSLLMFIQNTTYASINYAASGQLHLSIPNGKMINKKG